MKRLIKSPEHRDTVRHALLQMVRLFRRLQCRIYLLGKRIKTKTVLIGTTYGGYRIYPPQENVQVIVFSFGIGENMSFDESVMNEYDAKAYAFDPTPRAIQYVNSKHFVNTSFEFFPYGLEAFDGPVTFNLPIQEDKEPSGSIFERERLKKGTQIEVEMKRLKTIMEDLNIPHIDILKMDIEGSEFAVIDDILECNISFTQLCVEFHQRILKDGKYKMKRTLKNLYEHDYLCCAIGHSGCELTFIKERCS